MNTEEDRKQSLEGSAFALVFDSDIAATRFSSPHRSKATSITTVASKGTKWSEEKGKWICYFLDDLALIDPFVISAAAGPVIAFAAVEAISNILMGKILSNGINTSFVSNWAKKRNTFTKEQLAKGLRITTTTLRRWEDEPNKTLTPTQSEGFALFEHVFQRAVSVLGNEEQATIWLNKPALLLDNEVPIDLLETSIGAQCVLDLLTRIEYGVLA
jgi:putative toxin-antitoxin system antitoxin component (TIGR02293 family)